MSKASRKVIKRLFNPIKLNRAIRLHRNRKTVDRTTYDPQLKLYSDFLTNDMLHYGYFDEIDIDPEKISIHDMEVAQIKYAKLFIDHIMDRENPVLDVGCGMGGLAHLIETDGFHVTALTPDQAQANYIKDKYPEIPVIRVKFEEIDLSKRYGTICHAESLQYINLEKAFEIIDKILLPDGTWIICDYFRKHDDSSERSGHTFKKFENEVQSRKWQITKMEDITQHVLPTLKYVYVFGTRFLKPLSDFAIGKLKVKQPGIHYIAADFIAETHAKVLNGMETVNPDKFYAEKQYLFITIKKQKDTNR